MPRVSRLELPPLDYRDESLGRRLARLRRERGLTQADLAARIGILQTLVTDYEHDRLRLSAEMAVRFTLALGIPLDAWLLPEAASPAPHKRPSRAIARRMALLETLPRHHQRIVLTALDMLLPSFARRAEQRNQQVPRREPKNGG
jgi:transcriptional regulator with XRE-family HTH domain